MPVPPHDNPSTTIPSTESNAESSEEVKVFVTGFAPFRSDDNPSYRIAHSLPPTITLTHRSSSTAAPKTTTIRIIPYPEPIHVSWKSVRELIPAVYSSPSSPHYNPLYAQCSYIVHIGMGLFADKYFVERQGHRDGYRSEDVDKRGLRESEEEMGLTEGDYWKGCPEVLRTTLHVDNILETMRHTPPGGVSQLPQGITVDHSDDAGYYLCDFIYYSSLAHFWKKNGDNGKRPVVFLHVPPESDEAVLEKGRKVTEALIRAIVASERS